MSRNQDHVLYENEAFRLTTNRLEQAGLVAEVESSSLLAITRQGVRREVPIPAPGADACRYRGSIPVLAAMYNMAMHELKSSVTPDGLLLAGASWSTVWTRDIAYAAALGGALAEPAACRASLESRVKDGVIMQDTGTGGGWPISIDRVSWALGGWTLYLSTGDRDWLAYCAKTLEATFAQDELVLPAEPVLRPGETSFLDWRKQSYPSWMEPADIGATYAFGTNVLYYVARMLAARMFQKLGRPDEAAVHAEAAAKLARAIEEGFWSRAMRQYGMVRTAEGYLDERTDALATALAVISGLAGRHAERALAALPRSPWGTPVFSPYKADTPEAYHNYAIWPFVEAFVLMAHAEQQDTQGAARSMACLLRAAMAFGTNKENFHAETGRAEDTVQNSDRQLWSVTGMLALFYYGLFGIQYEHDNIVFAPCVPRAFAGDHWLTNLRIRDMVLDVHLNGYGTGVCTAMVNGKAGSSIIPLNSKGRIVVEIALMPTEDDGPEPVYPRAMPNLPAPEWDAPAPGLLRWKPVEGATSYCLYADGTALAVTAACTHSIARPDSHCCEYRVQAANATAVSCLSRPWNSASAEAVWRLAPLRIGEEAEYSVEGGQAWLDTRPCTSRLDYEKATLEAGRYRIRVRYCNATNSLGDGDTCALRELWADGRRVAVIPLPHNTQAGQWEDYTYTAPVTVSLQQGEHRFSLRYTKACANANGRTNQCMVRELELTALQPGAGDAAANGNAGAAAL